MAEARPIILTSEGVQSWLFTDKPCQAFPVKSTPEQVQNQILSACSPWTLLHPMTLLASNLESCNSDH